MKPWSESHVTVRRATYTEARATASICLRAISAAVFLFVLVLLPCTVSSQKKQRPAKPKSKQADITNDLAKSAKELAKLHEEFIKATRDYKLSLDKLRASYEKDILKTEVELTKSRELFASGLISRKALEASERAVAVAKDKVAEVDRNNSAADSQIADTLLEAEAEAKIRTSKPIPRGGFVSTAAMIRYNGGGAWELSDAWKVQRFFQDAFKKPLPIAVFGQGPIHNRWRLDHHNSLDVSLHPDGAEGRAVLGFLRTNGIPFLAFRQAIPGTATGPHIHIGRPSHRY